MPDLSLSEEQSATLMEFLDRSLGDLSVEIANTDKKSFRDTLKEKRDHLTSIQSQLQDLSADSS